MRRDRFVRYAFVVFIVALSTSLAPGAARAQTADELQVQISAHAAQIQALEDEIARYQEQLNVLGKQKQTLQSAIDELALSQKQLLSELKITQTKIGSANLDLERLSLSIGAKEDSIGTEEAAIARALQRMQEADALPLVAQVIGAHSPADAWRATDAAVEFNRALGMNIQNLENAKAALTENRDQVSAKKAELLSLKADLATQKRSVDASKNAEMQLLAQTKNRESDYEKLIADKRASEQSFEDELIALQSQLDLIVHPGSLPKTGTGLLSWPFANAFMLSCAARAAVFGNAYCITQYFGTTAFSTANPQVYNGHGHNAIDIGAPIGTPVSSALSGTVLATGNTDLAHDPQGRQCYSFGKWVMIDHHNGINTLYAHLSEIDVSKGESVAAGTLLGLSGMTGYATGPHLHFGVYASEGTRIMTLGDFRGVSGTRCANAVMPVASLDAYLNPLSYL